MTIVEAHYNFKLLYDQWDSEYKRDLDPFQIDQLLNKSQNIWSETYYSGYNQKQLGFENTQQRIDQMSSLVIKSPTTRQSGVLPYTVVDGVYEFRISDFEHDYLHMINAKVNIKKDNCSKTIAVDIHQHDDIEEIIKDEFRGPSFSWERVPAVFGLESPLTVISANTRVETRSLYVYTNQNFTVDALYPEYIKRPAQVSIGDYNDFFGNAVARTEFDVPDVVIHDIIDIAVREAMKILSDSNGFQLYDHSVKVNN
jgi:hypothetical protein